MAEEAIVDADQMPWWWLTRVKLPTGRRRRYDVRVNGRHFLRVEANNAVQVAAQACPLAPKDAHVLVVRL